MKPEGLLQSLGFSASETALYLAGLKLGSATAIQLGQAARLTRQAVYLLIPRLLEAGLFKEERRGPRRSFRAVDPQVLVDRAARIEHDLQRALPNLRALQSNRYQLPTTSVYENPLAMREFFRRFMAEATADDTVLLWVTNRIWLGTDPEFNREFVAFKNKLKLHEKIIAPDTEESRRFAFRLDQRHAEYRYVLTWGSPIEKWLWRDCVMVFTVGPNAPSLMVVESSLLATLERWTFERVWASLPPEGSSRVR